MTYEEINKRITSILFETMIFGGRGGAAVR